MDNIKELKAILIRPKGKLEIIKFGDMDKYFKGYTDHRTIYWLDNHGYKLVLICNDMSGSEINNMATQLGKMDMYGDCLLVDDKLNLDFEHLKKIIELSKQYKNINGTVCRSIEEYNEINKNFKEFMNRMKNK
jgi:hypothetical protein